MERKASEGGFGEALATAAGKKTGGLELAASKALESMGEQWKEEAILSGTRKELRRYPIIHNVLSPDITSVDLESNGQIRITRTKSRVCTRPSGGVRRHRPSCYPWHAAARSTPCDPSMANPIAWWSDAAGLQSSSEVPHADRGDPIAAEACPPRRPPQEADGTRGLQGQTEILPWKAELVPEALLLVSCPCSALFSSSLV